MKVKRSVKLSITLRDRDKRRKLRQSLMVAKIDALYIAIFGKPLLNELCVVLSSYYLMMKFEMIKGIAFVRGD